MPGSVPAGGGNSGMIRLGYDDSIESAILGTNRKESGDREPSAAFPNDWAEASGAPWTKRSPMRHRSHGHLVRACSRDLSNTGKEI